MLCSTALFSLSLNAQVPSEGLVAYYAFDGNVVDSSQNQASSQAVNPVWVKDRFGNEAAALYLSEELNNEVRASGDGLPRGEAPRTISMWIKPDAMGMDPGTVRRRGDIMGYGKINGDEGSVIAPFLWWPDRVSQLSFGSDHFDWNRRVSDWRFNRWHHVVWIYNGGNSAKLYLDGVPTAVGISHVPAKQIEDLALNTVPGPLLVGHYAEGHYNGAIDDLRIYNKALSNAEAAQLFDAEKPSTNLDGDALVAYLPFEQNANDVTGNGHHGRVLGAKLTEDRFGYPNSAYAFDGEDDVIIIPDDDALDFGFSDFTLSAWIKAQAVEAYSYVVGKYQQGEFPGYGMGFINGEYAYAFIGDSNTDNGIVQPIAINAISTEEWHFMVAAYDRDGNLTIYIDGLRRAVSLITPESLSISSDHDLYIGNLSPGLGFKGAIDDVAIYNRALPPQEVWELMMRPPFEIIQQPLGGMVGTGGAVILFVKVEGKGNFTYQWFKDSVELPGENNPSLVLSEVSYQDAGDYFVRVTTSDGSLESGPARIVVEGLEEPPLLVVQPVSSQLEVGESVQLSVEALGTETFTYQWFFNGKPFVGAVEQTLFIPQATEPLSGEYYVIVTNEYGEATSETATVTVTFIDTDGDGIGDWREIEMGTNPESADTDGDGLSDWVEIEETGTNPVMADSDADGLNDDTELNGDTGYITDPLVRDSDGDGLSDGEEVLRETYPTNPLVADTDADGLSDSEEIQLGINPTSEDTDGDGLGDADEVAYGYDPNEATEAAEGSLEIFRAVELRFFTLPGQTYQLHKSSDLEKWEASGEPFVAEGGFYSTFARQEVRAVFWHLFRVED